MIILEDVLEYPILNVGSTSIVEVEKNSKKVATYVATDDDYLDKVTYSISGDDSDLFNINSESGELTFKSAPDYQNPLGGTSNDPNTYSIRVNAVDKTGRADYTDVSVNVIDTLDDSSLLKIDTTSAASVDENTTLVHTFTADKPVTWSLLEGNDSHFFAVNTSKGSLSFSSAPDFENPSDADQNNDYVVTIRATDNENNTSEQTITVTINDVNEQVKETTEPEISKKENYDLIKSAEYKDGNFNFTLFHKKEMISWMLVVMKMGLKDLSLQLLLLLLKRQINILQSILLVCKMDMTIEGIQLQSNVPGLKSGMALIPCALILNILILLGRSI